MSRSVLLPDGSDCLLDGWSLVGKPRDHGVDDQHQQQQPKAEEDEAHRAGDGFPILPFIPDAMLIETTGGDQAIIPTLAFVQHFSFGDAPGEDDGVHWELLKAEVGVEEMHGEDEAGG
jgi:hypothetical protein